MTYVKWFNEIGIEDVPSVGGKNASLGEMYRNLTAEGVLVPNGFAVTAEAYDTVLRESGALEALHRQLDTFDPDDVAQLQTAGKACREIVYNCRLPEAVEKEILEGYEALVSEYGDDVSLAVRSSATAEDSPGTTSSTTASTTSTSSSASW
jgi:pyruvate,water dikinase